MEKMIMEVVYRKIERFQIQDNKVILFLYGKLGKRLVNLVVIFKFLNDKKFKLLFRINCFEIGVYLYNIVRNINMLDGFVNV